MASAASDPVTTCHESPQTLFFYCSYSYPYPYCLTIVRIHCVGSRIAIFILYLYDVGLCWFALTRFLLTPTIDPLISTE